MARLHKRAVPGNGVEKRAGRAEAALPKRVSARPARSGRRPGPAVCVRQARRGPKPPTSAPRPLQALACCWSRTCRSVGHSSARAGETQVAFPVPGRRDESTFTASMAGAIAPATAPRWDQDRPGAQSPRPAPAPPPAGASRPPGRALACGWCGLRRFRRKRRARAGERLCVLGACPQGHALSRGREDLKGRQAVGLLFRRPVWPPCTPRLCAGSRLSRRAVRYPAYCPAPRPRNARCSRSTRCA